MKTILDVCCGSKAFWFDKNEARTIYLDIRNETIQADKREGRKPIEIKPTYIANFQNIPFQDNTFNLVVFDPPHITADLEKQTGCIFAYYGALGDNWREMLSNGFSECFRVLKPNGTLIFKWAETKISISEILLLTQEKPLFGHKSGKLAKTHWVTFMKSL